MIYEEFLEEPLGHKSHELLHTHYTPRPAEVPQKLQEAEGGNGKSATGAARPAAARGA